jgi:hypothetical protein
LLVRAARKQPHSSVLIASITTSFFPLVVAHLLLQLRLDDALEGDGVGRELADTFPELLDGHLVLVEVEAEVGLLVDVRLLLDVERGGAGGIELLGDGGVRVKELLEEVGLWTSLLAFKKTCQILGRLLTEMVR